VHLFNYGNGSSAHINLGVRHADARVRVTDQNNNLFYALPRATPSNGDVLTASDANGTLGWAAPSGGGLTYFTEGESNGTQQTSTLTAATDNANLGGKNLALIPRQNGALTAQAPDGSATGGNARGTNAVDFGRGRSQATEVASGSYSTISGGYRSKASGAYSTVGGGQEVHATGGNSVASGGQENFADGSHSTICGGGNNDADGDYSFVGGGSSNDAASYGSVVCGGSTNEAKTNSYAAVVGGQNNDATGEYSFVGGGSGNIAEAQYATVSGGSGNDAENVGSTIGGGKSNEAKGNYATVSGGQSNKALGAFSTVAGGAYNTISSGVQRAVINGGDYNEVQANYGFVGGGDSNYAKSAKSVVINGKSNDSSGQYSSILNGENNEASGKYSTVINGSYVEATAASEVAFGGGYVFSSSDKQNQHSTYLFATQVASSMGNISASNAGETLKSEGSTAGTVTVPTNRSGRIDVTWTCIQGSSKIRSGKLSFVFKKGSGTSAPTTVPSVPTSYDEIGDSISLGSVPITFGVTASTNTESTFLFVVGGDGTNTLHWQAKIDVTMLANN